MKSSPYIIERGALNKRIVRIVIFSLLLGGAAGWIIAVAPKKAPKSTHVSIPSALFDVARTVCQNNGGYKAVIIEKESDKFAFHCADGLMLKDAIVRVK